MTREPQSAAGGFFIMIAIFVGVIAGAVCGQPSIGFIGGVVAGTIVALWIWLRDRKRIGH